MWGRSLGIQGISIVATKDEMHRNLGACYENWSTPMATACLLEMVTTDGSLQNGYTDFVKRTMIECQTGKDRLVAPLDEKGVTVGHKTGTSCKKLCGEYIGINDAGFVLLPEVRDIQ